MAPNERFVFLDTETTGLNPRLGHRIIEVAAVEANGRELTGKFIHHYVDPERDVDAGATAVHGFTWDDLKGKPKFESIADELLDFIRDAQIVIHNAPFDVSFLDQELARLRRPPLAAGGFTVIDSLELAKQKYPGKRNSLDALCDRLGVDNSQRNLHGALLDARLLADVYFGLTRGQGAFDMALPALATHIELPEDWGDDGANSEAIAVTVAPEHDSAHQSYRAKLAQQSGIDRPW